MMTRDDRRAERPPSLATVSHNTHHGERCGPDDTITPPDAQVTTGGLVRAFFGEDLEERPTARPCPNSPGFFYNLCKGKAGPMPCRKYRTCKTCRWVRADRLVRQIRNEEKTTIDWDTETYTDARGWERTRYTPVKVLVRPFGWGVVRERDWKSFRDHMAYVKDRTGRGVPYLQFPTHTASKVVFTPVLYLLNEHELMSPLPREWNPLASMLAKCLMNIPKGKRYGHNHGFGGIHAGYKGDDTGWNKRIGAGIADLVREALNYANNNGYKVNVFDTGDGGISWNPHDDNTNKAMMWGTMTALDDEEIPQ